MKRPIWCAAFLVAIAEPENMGSVTLCAERVGRTRAVVYLRRKVDPQFARDMDAALERCSSALVRLASRRTA